MSAPVRRLARLAPALALVVIAAWSAARVVGAGAAVPDDAAWAAAAAAIEPELAPDHLIVFAPAWVDPVGRLHLGRHIPLATAGRLDDARYPVIWELSIRGARSPATRGLTPTRTFTRGGVTVRRFDRPAAQLVTDLADHLGTATVDGNRARGPDRVLAEVGFTPRRCVQVVPVPDGLVTLTFRDVALGTQLAIGVGLADVFTRRDVRDPGELTVAVDGELLATVRVGVDDGWITRYLVTRPGRGTVTVTARAVGLRARDRLVCFAAEARR
ncbi:MAG: hypothetical protein R3B06_05545 [Kofleriaceae bacterium]